MSKERIPGRAPPEIGVRANPIARGAPAPDDPGPGTD